MNHEIGLDQLKQNIYEVLVNKKIMNLTDVFLKFQIIFNQGMDDKSQIIDKSVKEILLKQTNSGKPVLLDAKICWFTNIFFSVKLFLLISGTKSDKIFVYAPKSDSKKQPKIQVFDLNNNFKTCTALADESRVLTAGGILQDHFVMCGGLDRTMMPKGEFSWTDNFIYYAAYDDCLIIGEKKSYKMKRPDNSKKRYLAAAVTLNETTLWIVGGRIAKRSLGFDSKFETYVTRSSEFLTLNKLTEGPNLPLHQIGVRIDICDSPIFLTSIGQFG